MELSVTHLANTAAEKGTQNNSERKSLKRNSVSKPATAVQSSENENKTNTSKTVSKQGLRTVDEEKQPVRGRSKSLAPTSSKQTTKKRKDDENNDVDKNRRNSTIRPKDSSSRRKTEPQLKSSGTEKIDNTNGNTFITEVSKRQIRQGEPANDLQCDLERSPGESEDENVLESRHDSASYMTSWLHQAGAPRDSTRKLDELGDGWDGSDDFLYDNDDDINDHDDVETALIISEMSDKPYNHVSAVQEMYLETCEKLKQVPVTAFLKVCYQPEIILKNISLGPRGIKAICPSLNITSEATLLNLSGSDMRDKGLLYLANTLKENQLIASIDFSRNSLGPASAKVFDELCQNNANLTSIDISGNHFSDKGASYIADMIENSTSIKKLNLSNNGLGNAAARLIGSALGKNGSLTHLCLSWNKIQPEGAKRLINGVRDNVRLENLDLSHNGLGKDTARAIGRLLTENDILKELHLSNTRLCDKAVKTISRGLATNETLSVLDLSHNAFCCDAACSLFMSIMNNSNSGLHQLSLMGLVVNGGFLSLVCELSDRVPAVTVQYEETESRRTYKDYIKILFDHMDKQQLRYDDVLDASNSVTTNEFITRLQTIGVPLNYEDLDHFASMLDTTDSGKPLIRHLKQKWEEWEKSKEIVVTARKTVKRIK